MKRTAFFSLFFVFALSIPFMLGAEETPTADQIVERSDDLMRGKTSYAEMTMTITTPRYTRSVKMKAWTEGRDKAFIQILSPERDAGTTFLKVEQEMWNYLPKVERTIKIPSSMMLQSWMGSDFSNDDLARADSFIVDYEHRLVGEESIDGATCWKVELTPKPNAPVVWGKVVVWADKDGYVGRRVDYLDEDMQPAKRLTADRVITASGRKVASHVVMENLKDKGHKTEVVYDSIRFDADIPSDTFTQRNLTRGVH